MKQRRRACIVILGVFLGVILTLSPLSAWTRSVDNAEEREKDEPPIEDMMVTPTIKAEQQKPAKTFAQEEVDLKFNGNLRMRYINLTRPTGDTDTFEASQGFFEQRSLLGLSLRRGEPIGGQFTIVHGTRWGRATDTDNNGTAAQAAVNDSRVGVHDGTGNSNNMVLVSEAWAWWKATDSILVRLGRQGFTLADETVFSRNDFEQFPISLDGAVLVWDFDNLNLSGFGFKLEEYARPGIGGSDPEHNIFGVAIDGKEMPEVISLAHAHFVQSVAQQSVTDGSLGVDGIGKNLQRLGVALKLETTHWDFRVSGAYLSGQMKDKTNINSIDTQMAAYMYDTEIGYGWGTFFRTRIYAGYHFDSGDKDYQHRVTDSPVAGQDRRWSRYDAALFNRHKYSGAMDVIDWGNINYLTVGSSISPWENSKITLQYLIFQRSSSGDRISPGTRGRYMLGNGNTYTPGSPTSLAVGTELEAIGEYQMDNGFNAHLIAGVFAPGKYLQDGTTPTNGPIKQTYVQLVAMASYQF